MKRIENRTNYLFVEFDDAYQLEVILSLMREVAEVCRQQKFSKVLVDLSNMPGKISIMDRFQMGVAGANTFRGVAQVALIYRKDEINRFAETVGVNRGANVAVFGDAESAKKWLGIEQ